VTRGEPEGLRRPPVDGIDSRDGSVVLRLAGELDLYDSDAVGSALERLARQPPPRLVVDLGEVTFLDSTILGRLLEAKKRLPAGTSFALAAPTADVRRILEVSGLERHFDVRETVEEALLS
jgi:anti-anti-sigma factor